MSSYALYDFTESLQRVGIPIGELLHVHYGYGKNGDLSEWDGGFVVELRDGTFAHITGWCDTTGWGCQDDARVERHKSLDEITPEEGWDKNPADLNKWIEDGCREGDIYV